MGTKLTNEIIVGTSQIANSSHYSHDIKEQDLAYPQYPFCTYNRTVVIIIVFKQYSFVQNETVDKEYKQYYHQNNASSVNKQCPFLQNNRIRLDNNRLII